MMEMTNPSDLADDFQQGWLSDRTRGRQAAQRGALTFSSSGGATMMSRNMATMSWDPQDLGLVQNTTQAPVPDDPADRDDDEKPDPDIIYR